MQGVEFRPSESSDRPTLLLLHGWGYHRHAWPDSWLTQLGEQFQLVLVDLPGHGDGPEVRGDDADLQQLDAWLQQLMHSLPDQVALLGWSLGGQVALRLAQQYPQRVTSLVTLASNLAFTQAEDWPQAMALDTLLAFRAAYARTPAKTLQRFCALQAQGAKQAGMLKQLRELVQVNAAAGQMAGLHWLEHLRGQQAWQQLRCPALAILATADALVPAAVASHIQALNQLALVQQVDACHALPFDHDVLPMLMDFWEAPSE